MRRRVRARSAAGGAVAGGLRKPVCRCPVPGDVACSSCKGTGILATSQTRLAGVSADLRQCQICSIVLHREKITQCFDARSAPHLRLGERRPRGRAAVGDRRLWRTGTRRRRAHGARPEAAAAVLALDLRRRALHRRRRPQRQRGCRVGPCMAASCIAHQQRVAEGLWCGCPSRCSTCVRMGAPRMPLLCNRLRVPEQNRNHRTPFTMTTPGWHCSPTCSPTCSRLPAAVGLHCALAVPAAGLVTRGPLAVDCSVPRSRLRLGHLHERVQQQVPPRHPRLWILLQQPLRHMPART